MAKSKSIIVIGSSPNALHAAASARRWNDDAEVIVIGEGAPCADENFIDHNRITLRNARVLKLDPDANCIVLISANKEERLPYDTLIYEGFRAAADLKIAGLDESCLISSLDTACYLEKHRPQKVVVIGAGMLGVQTALCLKERCASVTLIDSKNRIVKEFSWAVAHALHKKLKEENIVVIQSDHVQQAKRSRDEIELTTLNGLTLHADVVINATTLRPQLSLLADAGCALDPDGYVRVDDHLATTLPNVYACGYAIKVPMVRTFERKWLSSSPVLQKTAMIAGKNAACALRDRSSLNPVTQTMVLSVNKTHFARTGLSEEEARTHYGDANLTVITVFEKEACVRLLFETSQKEIIGAELFGEDNVHGRITLLSHAVREGFTPERLLDVEMMFENKSDSLEPLFLAATRAHYHFLVNAPVISLDTLALWLTTNRDFRLVDVGETPYFTKPSIKQMMHLPLARLREQVSALSDGEPIVLYAAQGEQSQIAQRTLLNRGLKNVYNLDGGLLTFSLLLSPED